MADGIVTIPWRGSRWPCQAGPERRSGTPGGPGPFLAGPENRLVEPAVRGVLDQRPAAYNPLVLYGPSGTGKSHLARGLAAAWQESLPRRAVSSIPRRSISPANWPTPSRPRRSVDFRSRYRTASLLVFEDVGRLAEQAGGPGRVDPHVGRLLARRRASGRRRRPAPPAELRGLMPGLQSRLSAGLAVPLSPPGPAARLAILRQLAASPRDRAGPSRSPRSLAEDSTARCRNCWGRWCSWMSRPAWTASRSTPRRSATIWPSARGRSSREVRDIAVLATARHFSLELADLRGASRRRPVVAARDVAMYLARLSDRRPASSRSAVLRRPRPYDRHARLPQDRGPLEDDPAIAAGRRAIATKAAGINDDICQRSWTSCRLRVDRLSRAAVIDRQADVSCKQSRLSKGALTARRQAANSFSPGRDQGFDGEVLRTST